jgi:hypothetical protein
VGYGECFDTAASYACCTTAVLVHVHSCFNAENSKLTSAGCKWERWGLDWARLETHLPAPKDRLVAVCQHSVVGQMIGRAPSCCRIFQAIIQGLEGSCMEHLRSTDRQTQMLRLVTLCLNSLPGNVTMALAP